LIGGTFTRTRGATTFIAGTFTRAVDFIFIAGTCTRVSGTSRRWRAPRHLLEEGERAARWPRRVAGARAGVGASADKRPVGPGPLGRPERAASAAEAALSAVDQLRHGRHQLDRGERRRETGAAEHRRDAPERTRLAAPRPSRIADTRRRSPLARGAMLLAGTSTVRL
jgi:hypothetical protein